MYLLSLLIIDQLFFGSINTLDFINNLIIDIKTALIDTVKFVFSVFWVLFVFFSPLSIFPVFLQFFIFPGFSLRIDSDFNGI